MVAVSNTGGRRRRRWLIVSAVVVLLVVWLALLGLRALSAYHHDRDGLARLELIKSDLSPGQLSSHRSQQLLDQAHADFTAAQSELSSPLFAPVTVLPVLGRQLRSVRDLSAAAGTVSEVGSTFLSQVHGLLDQPHGAGPQRIASLRQLAAISAAAVTQLHAIDTGPSQALIGPLAHKRAQFVSQLDVARRRLANAAAVSSVTATILQGPQTYLVLAANNAEMRAGSGAYLEVGTATTDNGSIHLGALTQSGTLTLPVGAVTVTGDLERNWGWLRPGVGWRNLGLTPQFDVTAPLAARMWTTLTDQPVDGVLALDVVGLRQLLQATGPVTVDGNTIGADNVEQFLLHDQYDGLSDNSTGGDSRVDALGVLAGAVLDRLQSQSTDLTSLATSLSSAVSGRHLMLWSKSPVAEAAWVATGLSGTISARSLGFSLINQGGNKLDQYVPVHVTVVTRPSGSGTAVTMTARLANQTPLGQSQFIAGPFPGVPVAYGGYTGLATANLPADASDFTMTGAGPLSVRGAEGPTWVLAAPLTVARGDSATVVVHFRLPTRHGDLTVIPSARVPSEQWTVNGRTSSDASPISIIW